MRTAICELAEELKVFGAQLRMLKEPHLRLTLSGRAPSELTAELEAELAQRTPDTDLTQVAQRIVEGCVAVLRGACAHLPSEMLDSVRCLTGHISGEEWMAAYEICFQANGASMELTVPDFAHFKPEHLQETEKVMGRATLRLHRDAYHWCMLVPCHEVVHLFQHVAGQTDPNPHSWSAEHDASVTNASLLYAISELPMMAPLLPKRLVWEILMDDFNAHARTFRKWQLEPEASYILEGYSEWVASFGLRAPENRISEDTVTTEHFKSVIPYDYFSEDVAECEQLLSRMLFPPHRTGDVYSHELEPAGLVQAAGGRMGRLSQAVGAAWWDQFQDEFSCMINAHSH